MIDVNVYKAVDPTMNMSIDAAKKLQGRLLRVGFHVAAIFCQPQFDGKGYGISQDVTLAELIQAGVPVDVPIHLMFRFAGVEHGDNCALVDQFFGDGDLVGVQRIYDMINPGTQGGYLFHVMRLPAVFNMVNDWLKGEPVASSAKSSKADKSDK